MNITYFKPFHTCQLLLSAPGRHSPYKERKLKLKTFGRIFILGCLLALLFTVLSSNAQAATAMTASESCIGFIKDAEGFSAKPYYDYSQHTVGYGTKCPTEKYFEYLANGISREEAEILLRQTVAEVGNTINYRLIEKYNLPLSQHQFDALVSFSYNLGTSWMSYDSTLRNAILRNAGAGELVYAFSLYSTAGGNYLPELINRRLCEANMFLNGIYSRSVSDRYGYVLYDANGGTLTYRVQGFIYEDHALPVADAQRSGDTFLGWYSGLTGGSLVNTLTADLSGKTLFARWQSGENTPEADIGSVVVTVTGDVVNIRKGPGTNYGIARQIYQNDVLIVSHVTDLMARKWGKVQDGWICLEYTNYNTVISGNSQPETSPQPPVESPLPDTNMDNLQNISGTVRVNDLLRIRSGPGTTYSTVGYLTNGDQIEILETKTGDSMVWARFSRGWVSMNYIEIQNPDITPAPAPAPETQPPRETEPETIPEETTGQTNSSQINGRIIADALRIRSGPGSEYAIAGFYYQNDAVVISEVLLNNQAYWGQTDRGWIHMDYVQIGSADAEPSAPEQGRVMTVIADCLRVRKETRTDSRIAQLLYYGDKVTVLETKTVDGITWGRVHNGWVCMDYVQ